MASPLKQVRAFHFSAEIWKESQDVFEFSEYRPRTSVGMPEKQSRAAIGELYSLLEQAGVKAEQIFPVNDDPARSAPA